jgi:predicted patatin/cPLA2 family phospholipase
MPSDPSLSEHPVARLVRERRRARSRAGARADGARVGLAIEGGAVRGVVSGGMLAALEELGMAGAIDVVYGSSAGAINGACFLDGKAGAAVRLYTDDGVRGAAVDVGRVLHRRPILDLDWLVDGPPLRSVGLDWAHIVASPAPLCVAASSLDALRPAMLRDLGGADELRLALKAGAAIPLLSPPVTFRGERFVDGSVLLSHPTRPALRDGCTHVLSLSTRPRDQPLVAGAWRRWLTHRLLERVAPGLGDAYRARVAAYVSARRQLAAMTRSGAGPPYVLDLTPANGRGDVGMLDRDRRRVAAGAAAGYDAAMAALGGEGWR